MADKNTALSITIRAIDQATAKFRAINAQILATTKPVGALQGALSKLGSTKSETGGLIGAFEGLGGIVAGVGRAVVSVLSKVAEIGGVVGVAVAGAVAGLIHLSDGFDDLGKKAQLLGVGVDFLAQMRYAAEKTGIPVEQLDEGLRTFTENLGTARAGTGRLAAFLEKASPPLLRQLKAAKSSEAAFDLLAKAMAKLHDPTERAALAQKAFGESYLAPLFAKGAIGIKELRDRYTQMAGSQKAAAAAGAQVHDSMLDLHAVFDGMKASLVTGIAPALSVVIDKLRVWFQGHQADVARWAAELGAKIPGAIQAVIHWLGKVYAWIAGHADDFRAIGDAIGEAFKDAVPVVKAACAAIVAAADGIRSTIDFIKHPFAKNGPSMAKIAREDQLDNKGLFGQMVSDYQDDQQGWLHAYLADHANDYRHAQAAIAAVRAAHNAARDKTVDGVDFAAGAAGPMNHDTALALRGSQDDHIERMANAIVNAVGVSKGGKLTVEFSNAPKGMRVKQDANTDVDLSLGYQMLWSP